MTKKYEIYENLDAGLKSRIETKDLTLTCIGKYKTGSRFIMGTTEPDIPEFLMTQDDVTKLYQRHGILPMPLFFWPVHGIRYTDFRQILRDALHDAKFTANCPQRATSYFDSTPSSMGIRMQYDTGRGTRLYLAVKVTYRPAGVALTADAYLSGVPGENRVMILLLDAAIILPDDKSLQKSLEFFLNSITQDRIAAAIQSYKDKL